MPTKKKAPAKKLKLFVWQGDNVLQDYTSGMICVLARDHAHALRLIEKEVSYAMGSFPVNKFVVVTKPSAFLCWGGG